MDSDERAVLGDELQQRGDPRGDLINTMLALAALPESAPPARRGLLERKIAALLDTHHEAFFGELAPHVQRLSKPDIASPVLDFVRWDRGFVDSVALRPTHGFELDRLVRVLRSLPIMQELRRIVLSWGRAREAIADLAREPPPALCEIVVERIDSLDDLTELAPLLARLETIELHGGVGYVWFESSTLKRFEMFRTGDTPIAFDARLSAIEHLGLGGFRIDRDFFARYPTLRTAKLTYCTFDDDVESPPHVEVHR